MLIEETGTFNFHKFGELKKEINNFLKFKYGKTFKEIFPDSKMRENIYKKILGFNLNTNVFQTSNSLNGSLNLNPSLESIVEDLKEYVINNLYNLG